MKASFEGFLGVPPLIWLLLQVEVFLFVPLKMSLMLLTEVTITLKWSIVRVFVCVLLLQIFSSVFHCSFLSFLSHDSCFPGSEHSLTLVLKEPGWGRSRQRL